MSYLSQKHSLKLIIRNTLLLGFISFSQSLFAITAVPDTATTETNQAVTIAVLNNDFLEEDSGSSAASSSFTAVCIFGDLESECELNERFPSMSLPSNGTISLSGKSIIYTPNTDFSGTDSFEYGAIVNENPDFWSVDAKSATVTITVNAPVVEETPVEETPVEETPVEETPVEETPVEEKTISAPTTASEEEKELVTAVVSLCDGTATTELSESCSALVDLTEEEQISALSTISADQVTAEFTSTIKMSRDQSANLTSRLSQLRNNSHGLNISGLQIKSDDRYISGDWLHAVYDSMSGGSAGSDDVSNQLSQFGLFANGSITVGERDTTSNEMGYDLDSDNYTLGVDYRLNDSFVAGAAYGYSSSRIVFGATGDDMDNKIDNVFVYSSWYQDDFYLDTTIGYSAGTIRTARRIVIPNALDTIATGQTHTEQLIIQITGNYDFSFGAFTAGPYLSLDIIDGEIDSYSEQNGGGFEVSFDKQDINSKLATLGGHVQYAFGYSWGVLLPHARLEVKNEFETERDVISGRFLLDPAGSNFSIVADDIDSSWLQAGVGLSAVFPYGVSAYVDYETAMDLDHIELHTFSFGGRWELVF